MKTELALDEAFHFLPDVMNLLGDTIPKICRSKMDVVTFFRGAGTPQSMIEDFEERIHRDRQSVGKYEIARTVLRRLNEGGDRMLRQRREVIRRIAEFEDFSSCYDNDRLPAEALVKRVRELVEQKDSFTRMKIEAERERQARLAAKEAEIAAQQTRLRDLEGAKDEFFHVFAETDPHKRGKMLEPALNKLFRAHGMLVRESFTLRGVAGEGIVEQIDGLVDIDGELYLVEMKWWTEPIGPPEMAQHLSRVFGRGEARGIFISASPFTPAAITHAREALRDRVSVLCDLRDIVAALEERRDLKAFFRERVRIAIADKKPLAGEP